MDFVNSCEQPFKQFIYLIFFLFFFLCRLGNCETSRRHYIGRLYSFGLPLSRADLLSMWYWHRRCTGWYFWNLIFQRFGFDRMGFYKGFEVNFLLRWFIKEESLRGPYRAPFDFLEGIRLGHPFEDSRRTFWALKNIQLEFSGHLKLFWLGSSLKAFWKFYWAQNGSIP